MQSLERYGDTVRGGLTRATSRALAHIQNETSLTMAVVEAQAEIQAAKVDAVGLVAQRALQDVAYLSQVEQLLSQTVPLATSRLQAIADLATLGIGQVVTDTVTRLRST